MVCVYNVRAGEEARGVSGADTSVFTGLKFQKKSLLWPGQPPVSPLFQEAGGWKLFPGSSLE